MCKDSFINQGSGLAGPGELYHSRVRQDDTDEGLYCQLCSETILQVPIPDIGIGRTVVRGTMSPPTVVEGDFNVQRN